jgi:hypothetical protein
LMNASAYAVSMRLEYVTPAQLASKKRCKKREHSRTQVRTSNCGLVFMWVTSCIVKVMSLAMLSISHQECSRWPSLGELASHVKSTIKCGTRSTPRSWRWEKSNLRTSNFRWKCTASLHDEKPDVMLKLASRHFTFIIA